MNNKTEFGVCDFVFPDSIDNVKGCKEVLNRAPEVLSDIGILIAENELDLQKARATIVINNPKLKRDELRSLQDTDENILDLQIEIAKLNAIYSLWKEGQINARAFHKELTQS